jgi:hypothetical protein
MDIPSEMVAHIKEQKSLTKQLKQKTYLYVKKHLKNLHKHCDTNSGNTGTGTM